MIFLPYLNLLVLLSRTCFLSSFVGLTACYNLVNRLSYHYFDITIRHLQFLFEKPLPCIVYYCNHYLGVSPPKAATPNDLSFPRFKGIIASGPASPIRLSVPFANLNKVGSGLVCKSLAYK